MQSAASPLNSSPHLASHLPLYAARDSEWPPLFRPNLGGFDRCRSESEEHPPAFCAVPKRVLAHIRLGACNTLGDSRGSCANVAMLSSHLRRSSCRLLVERAGGGGMRARPGSLEELRSMSAAQVRKLLLSLGAPLRSAIAACPCCAAPQPHLVIGRAIITLISTPLAASKCPASLARMFECVPLRCARRVIARMQPHSVS